MALGAALEEREQWRGELLAFLETIARPDVPLTGLASDEGLVDAGVIDSLALLEIIAFLESRHGVDFRARGLDPQELHSIESILTLVAEARG